MCRHEALHAKLVAEAPQAEPETVDELADPACNDQQTLNLASDEEAEAA